MMIEIHINDNEFEGTFTSLNDVNAFFEGAEELSGMIRNWSYCRFDDERHIVATYGSRNPINAAAEFYDIMAMERDLFEADAIITEALA